MIKQFYFKQFSLAWVNKVKWFQVLLCITDSSIKHQLFVYTQLNDQAVQFQTIQFSISHLLTLSLNAKQFYLTYGATTPCQSGPGSDGNEEVLHISQSFRISGVSPSDCLMSYPGHSQGECYPSEEIQSVYSTVKADWAIRQS